jgi:hypothetical protein
VTSAAAPFCLGRFAGPAGAFTGLVARDVVIPLSAVREDLGDDLCSRAGTS